ncbi:FGGY-family carbohydrate kinase [Shigella sonnei]
MLEGVGYALADGMDVVHACGITRRSVTLIGGGARSKYWRQMLADISGQQLDYRTGGDVGQHWAQQGWRRLRRSPEKSLIELLPQLPLEQSHLPDAQCYAGYQPRRETFRRLYQQLLRLMA